VSNPSPPPRRVVTASDVAGWVFCPESLRLSDGGHLSANENVLDAGTAHHVQMASVERRTGCASMVLLLATLTCSVVGLILWVRG
jgi:hypothetical protein